MNFLSLKYKAIFFSLFSLLNHSIAYADNITLNVKPHKCVALHQGQVCYQKIAVNWHSEDPQKSHEKYCLHIKGNPKAEFCSGSSSNYIYHFAEKSDAIFELKDSDGNVVVSRNVQVVSVYKGSRRSTTGWRLF